MTITIPINEDNWLLFYLKCKNQKVHVRSRYVGVYINTTGKKITFMARCETAGKEKFLGRFPLTKAGEEAASNAYKRYIETIPESEVRRHVVNKKKPYKRT